MTDYPPADAIVCLAQCWACNFGQHEPAPSLHPWWDADDVDHAAETGQPPPSGHCGCGVCGAPAVRRAEASS